MDVIQDIRSGYEVDRPGDATPIQRALERALDHLSDQLYRADSHFIMEFVQNADDNKYHPNVTPTLSMRVEDLKMVLSCNETGFEGVNVRSICNIGDSTKKNNRGFIGEKGIGFKSAFKVADVIHIASGPYTFKFDRKEKLGMIAPIWDNTLAYSAGKTTFTLDLNSQKTGCPPPGVAFSRQLGEIRPSLLLFLRTLRSIEIDIAVGDSNLWRTVHISRTDVDSNIVQLTRVESGVTSTDRYFIVKNIISTVDLQEQKRQGIKDTEIVLAFPIDEGGLPKTHPQDVHAFLPMRKFGFNFLIQADFLTSSSREDVLEDSPWNLRIRDSIVETFIKAINTFRGHPNLRDTWIRFLPSGIVDSFFRTVETSIFSKLTTLEILRDRTGNYKVPSSILNIPRRFIYNESYLIPIDHMRLYYLSSDYNQSVDIPILRRLGVRDMNDDDLLDGLASMSSSRAFIPLNDAWHDTICSLLMSIISYRTTPRIHNLRLLPLDDGSWVRAGDAPKYMFDKEVSGVPDHVEYRRISANVISASRRYSFFTYLGAQAADPAHIAQAILNRYGHHLQPKAHIDNARFFFLHRNAQPSLPDTSQLQVVDEQGACDVGRALYLDWPSDKGRLRNVLPSTARFIHPLYMEQFKGTLRYEPWLRWLRDNLMVNTAPRLINDGLSPEFKDMIRRLNLLELLDTLKAFWPCLSSRNPSPWRNQLSREPITLDDGSQSTIGSMFLRRGSFKLAQHDNLDEFFLPVPDPESIAWDFLSTLGVAMDVNASFYLKLLIRHQKSGINKLDEVERIYKQLDARFNEKSGEIRQAFKGDPLIYTASKCSMGNIWARASDVYWDGPLSMTSKIRLCSLFPSLDDFFHKKLQIPNAPPTIIIDELKELSTKWQGKIIGEEVQNIATTMLIDLGKLIKEKRVSDVDVRKLVSEKAIFPASGGQGGKHLCKLSEIYIPDRDDRIAKVFRGQVILLDLSTIGHISPHINTLLQSSACVDLVRNIEHCVDRQTDSSAKGEPHLLSIAKFTRSCEFIERLLYNGTKPSKRQLEVVSKIKAIDIRIVDTISSTLSLDGIVLASSELIDFSEGDSEFTVRISKYADTAQAIMEICECLHQLLQIDIMKLYLSVTSEPRALQSLFQLANVNDVDFQSLGDDAWFLSSTIPRSSLNGTRSNRGVSDIGSDPLVVSVKANNSSIDIHGTSAVEGVQSEIDRVMENLSGRLTPEVRIFTSGHFPTQSLEKLAISPPPIKYPGSFSSITSSINISKVETETQHETSSLTLARSLMTPNYSAAAPIITTSSSGWEPPMFFAETSQPSPYQKINGILGEYYVYTYLLRIIGPSFGPDNWTSELRAYVRGFETFEGSSLSDFTYDDRKGILTSYLYKDSPQTIDKWSKRWPKYHIEVKSTSSGYREPFHMSRRQLDITLGLKANNENEDSSTPKDVYVLIRVWDVRNSSESLAFFVDPISSILGGGLRIASESVELMIGD